MKKATLTKLSIQRVTVGRMARAQGGWYVGSYGDGCSHSCHTCNDDPMGGCWQPNDTDLCQFTISCAC